MRGGGAAVTGTGSKRAAATGAGGVRAAANAATGTGSVRGPAAGTEAVAAAGRAVTMAAPGTVPVTAPRTGAMRGGGGIAVAAPTAVAFGFRARWTYERERGGCQQANHRVCSAFHYKPALTLTLSPRRGNKSAYAFGGSSQKLMHSATRRGNAYYFLRRFL
jgi:hypothetical protein